MKNVNRTVLLHMLCMVCLLASFMVFAMGCSPKEPEIINAHEKETDAQVTIDWTLDSDCGICHSNICVSSAESEASPLYSKHSNQKCVVCHYDDSGLRQAHANVTADMINECDKLRLTSVEEEHCLSCHGDWKSLEKTTENSKVIIDSKGTVVNPHQLPSEVKEHAQRTCTDCHIMHTSENPANAAKQYCVSCHHDNVFECHTCHE